jgi:hypothetical protein
VPPNQGDSGYERQLEDACLFFWDRLTGDQFIKLRREAPALADFLAHLTHSMSHEEAMMRRNVWRSQEVG